jgi:flagellin
MISFQTNVASMIAENNLNTNNTFQTQTITQLTSGFRINSSGDDAAGLAVANGFAANVAELNQGVLNANNGVSTLQIVDGGLSNISTMLNRMQTLATESASTTFTGNRATLDTEYQTLVGEINREASNVGLGTTNATNATHISVYIGGGQSSSSGSAVSIDLTNGKVDAAALGLQGTSVAGPSPVTIGTVPNGLVLDGTTETYTVNTAAGSSAFGITGKAGDTASSQLAELNQDLGTVGLSASLDTKGQLAITSPTAFSVGVTGAAGLAQNGTLPVVNAINTSLNNDTLTYVAANTAPSYTITEGTTTATILGSATNGLGTGATDSSALASINSQLQAQGITDLSAVATGVAGAFSLQGATPFTAAAVVTANSTGTVGIVAAGNLSNSTAAIGGGGALNAINAITAAVQNLGTVQGIVGAGENKLGYAISLANSQITNFSSAESQIRDANIATEAANLTKAQVLEQASVAAMAQANSAPQAILSLLKG